eukprot:TRINITY_DN5054_c2_g1_i1.p1 TRINITY_DN5054_c2_g1~~TRINITY_DN5054_c2_g1_i1.p1  ORF type:complete len:237 (-),score=50.14 TRINITY_DN5054_c2_g1_i1:76-786(-)
MGNMESSPAIAGSSVITEDGSPYEKCDSVNAANPERIAAEGLGGKKYKVVVALTYLTPTIAQNLGAPVAYHSSVAVDGQEFSFSRLGLVRASNYLSHKHLKGPVKLIDYGYTSVEGLTMARALRKYFRESTYDMLRKNCNAFSDCALFYLVGRRLDEEYRSAEKIGASMEEKIGLIRMLSLGDYSPNTKADGFDTEEVLGFIAETLKVEREAKAAKEAKDAKAAETAVAKATLGGA